MENDNGFVGDIKYSILDAKTFIARHPGWQLLMGQEIDNSTGLGQLGFTKLPDARGVFLRGLNVSNEPDKHNEYGDPEISRAVGSYQSDDFKCHNHRLDFIIGHGLWSYGDNDPGRGWACQWNSAPNTRASHNEGGKETRPRNIALYIYIKVN